MARRLLFDELEADEGARMREERSGSFVDNMQLPVQRKTGEKTGRMWDMPAAMSAGGPRR